MSKYKLDKSAQVVEDTNYTMTQEEVCERLNDLEAKLAEKDAELEEAKQHRTQILNFGKRTKKVVIANPYGEDCVVYNQEDQDKISFAVEQLEKVKRHIIEDTVWELTYEDVLGIIDNQIKQLKEMK